MKIYNVLLTVKLLILLVSTLCFAQQELNICAIRVSFQEDQNSLTTGNGLFLLDTTAIEPFTVDPPPHNKSYFEDQIIAVKNYYLAASKGNLIINGDVYPVGQNDSYQLDQEMSYYHPNTTDEENDQRLVELLVDAVQIADTDIDFSLYDVVTIFHAGVGKDIDVGFDETPQDIPSLYLSFEFLQSVFGSTYNGITVDNGQNVIENGIILPETESQVDFQLALTGIFASNIASHLGAYDLFSATEQVTGIGQFGLMDVGQFNVRGLIPSIPSAFSRKLLGWDNSISISEPENSIVINRYNGENSKDSTIIKIPINSDEYYLIEYRGERSINIDSVYFELLNDRNEPPTYLEVLQSYIPNNITVSDSTGVLLKVDNYDWGLPGAGILIWHIDEKVIAEKGNVNRINDDPANRAVDLEEADGSQDIGFTYDITEPGFQSELGTWLDFWFDMSENRPLYQNEFSPTSSPNTKNNRNYANSYIILDNFSDNFGNTMSFNYSRDFYENGFPVNFGDSNDFKFSDLKHFNFSSNNSILMTSDNAGGIYATTKEGKGIFADSIYKIIQLPVAEKTEFALADANTDAAYDKIIVTTYSGILAGFDLFDLNIDYLADTLFFKNIGTGIKNKPVVSGQNFYLTTNENKILQYNFDGVLLDSLIVSEINSDLVIKSDLDDLFYSSNSVFSPIVVDIDSDGSLDNITFPDSNSIMIYFSNGDEKTYKTFEKINSLPAIGDIDLDGYYEIIYNSNKSINGINYNDAQISNFPLTPVLLDTEHFIGTPLIADIDNDQVIDVISITNQGQIFAHNSEGKLLPIFPISAGGNVNTSPVILDLDNDAYLELFTINQNGDINGWQFESGYTEENLWWTQQTFTVENNLYFNRLLLPKISQGNDLLPAKKVYNYPNPNIDDFTNIRYYLTESANVNIKIFDLSGDIVDQFKGSGLPGIDQEIKWDVKNIQSGVYLCRIEAKSANKSDVRIIKIMVIH